MQPCFTLTALWDFICHKWDLGFNKQRPFPSICSWQERKQSQFASLLSTPLSAQNILHGPHSLSIFFLFFFLYIASHFIVDQIAFYFLIILFAFLVFILFLNSILNSFWLDFFYTWTVNNSSSLYVILCMIVYVNLKKKPEIILSLDGHGAIFETSTATILRKKVFCIISILIEFLPNV